MSTPIFTRIVVDGRVLELDHLGDWNASTNTPTLASSSGQAGQSYRVGVAGSTSLDGESSWDVDDFAVFDGTAWFKVSLASGGTGPTGAIVDSDFAGTFAGVLRRTGSESYEAVKFNFGASADPTTSDDSNSDYQVGSRWFNTTANTEFVCLDASVGAAVWVETTQSGGGGGDISGFGSPNNNSLTRWHGAGGDTIQGTGITVDDLNNITGVGTLNGRDISADGTKLDGIEANADVTDAANVDAAGAVMESDYSDHQVLAYHTDIGAVVPVTVAEDAVLGRLAGGQVGSLDANDLRNSILNVEDGADVTDAANVEAAGAVMDSDFSGSYHAFLLRDTTGVYRAVKYNRLASSNPTVNNDETEDYQIGSRWYNTSASTEFVCLGAATGAAVWVETTQSPASGGGDVSGPGSSTNQALVRWDGTSGDTVQDSLVTVDNSGNVTVPGTVDGRDLAADGTKLDGIEANADVTDAANVAAAGAVMDTDYTANSVVAAIFANTPVTIELAGQELLGRPSGGNVSGVNVAQLRSWLSISFTQGFFGGTLAELNAVVSDATLEEVDSTSVSAAGAVMTDEAKAKGDILVAPGANSFVVLTAGADGEVLTADSSTPTGLAWATPSTGGGGDVSGPTSSTNNALVRWDGAGGDTIQSSGITIDDSDNISGVGTLNGRDLAADGSKLDGIEANADVTDAANVDAAGAVMESDYTAQSVMVSVASGSPSPVQLTANQVLGRAGGNITAIDFSALQSEVIPAKTGVIYVGKHGDDSNTGTSAEDAVLTLEEALSKSSSGDVIQVIDDGVYTLSGDFTLSNRSVDAPHATISVGSSGVVGNKIELAGSCYFRVGIVIGPPQTQDRIIDIGQTAAGSVVHILDELRTNQATCGIYSAADDVTVIANELRCSDSAVPSTLVEQTDGTMRVQIDRLSYYFNGGASAIRVGSSNQARVVGYVGFVDDNDNSGVGTGHAFTANPSLTAVNEIHLLVGFADVAYLASANGSNAVVNLVGANLQGSVSESSNGTVQTITPANATPQVQVFREIFPISADDTVHDYFSASDAIRINKVVVTPLGASAPSSATSDVTLSVTNLTATKEVLPTPTVSIDGGTINQADSLSLGSQSNREGAEGDVYQVSVVCPTDALGDLVLVEVYATRT